MDSVFHALLARYSAVLVALADPGVLVRHEEVQRLAQDASGLEPAIAAYERYCALHAIQSA